MHYRGQKLTFSNSFQKNREKQKFLRKSSFRPNRFFYMVVIQKLIIPKDGMLLNLWEKSMGFQLKPTSRICELHLEIDDVIKTWESGQSIILNIIVNRIIFYDRCVLKDQNFVREPFHFARNAGPVTPRTPNPSKRNLSSSSLSPSQTDKKSKVFITPNRFAALATNDPDDQEAAATSASNSLGAPPANQPHTVQARKMVIPPIVIKNIKNFSAFKNALTDITSSEGFTCRATSTYLKVIPSSRINYNTIIDYLHDTETSFHSYTPRHLRTYRVAIRNLHHSTLNTDIINALNELEHWPNRSNSYHWVCYRRDIVLIPRIKMIQTHYPFEFKRTQFPLKVCFAMTINKSQGQ
ncbi:Nucleic-acid-binding protein [Aphis craccivora]|uniref:Nucleic-acid-binding protein n=1 Tax=Aphis craccivora TaxID=307492 RepID=A0A6G0YEX2_APHCR|nr:Nucleic-acid-binding protein [Aphis craccivora]